MSSGIPQGSIESGSYAGTGIGGIVALGEDIAKDFIAKDFDEFFWNTFKKILNIAAEHFGEASISRRQPDYHAYFSIDGRGIL